MPNDPYMPTAPRLGAVNRTGNSYAGGNVSGSVSINGRAPAGTFSSISTGATPPPPPQALTTGTPTPAVAPAFNPATGVGRPNALGSLADTNAQIASLRGEAPPGLGVRPLAPAAPPAQLGVARAPVAAAIPPAPAAPSLGASPAQQFFVGGGMAPQPQPAAASIPAPPPPAPAPPAPTAPPQPQQAVLAFRDGGMVHGPGTSTSDSIPAVLSNGEAVLPADTVRALGPANVEATIAATHAPAGQGAYRRGRPAFADGGLVDEEELRRRGAGTGPASAAAVAQQPAPPPVVAPTLGTTPAVQPSAVSMLPLGGARSGNGYSEGDVPGTPAIAPGSLGGAEDTNTRLARLQASNALTPQGGLTVIDNGGPNRNADFNDSAAVRTIIARGAPPGRNGAQVFAGQLGVKCQEVLSRH